MHLYREILRNRFFSPLMFLFFPYPFFYCWTNIAESFVSFSFSTPALWSLTVSFWCTQILETLHEQTACISRFSCVLYEKREGQIITLEGFTALMWKSVTVFSVSWSGFAWLGQRQEQFFVHSVCRLHNLQSRRESTNKYVYYSHCRGWEFATSSGLQQMSEAPLQCWELEE